MSKKLFVTAKQHASKQASLNDFGFTERLEQSFLEGHDFALQRITSLEAQVKVLDEAVDFYVKPGSWKLTGYSTNNYCGIADDHSRTPNTNENDFYGGKRAREAKEKVRKMRDGE